MQADRSHRRDLMVMWKIRYLGKPSNETHNENRAAMRGIEDELCRLFKQGPKNVRALHAWATAREGAKA